MNSGQWEKCFTTLMLVSLSGTILVFFRNNFELIYHLDAKRNSAVQKTLMTAYRTKTLDLLDDGKPTSRRFSSSNSTHWRASSPVMSSYNTTSIMISQEERKKRVEEACQKLSPVPWSTVKLKQVARETSSLFIDDHLKYIYCRVGKVASTTWVRVLLLARGKFKMTDPNKLSQARAYEYLKSGRILRPLSWYSVEEIEYRLKHYFKFIFVRHPLDRLVSAFKDRLKSDHAIPRRLFSKLIIHKYRQPGKDANEEGKGVRFNEFVRYVVDPATRQRGYNPHWRPHYDRCHPCLIHYDFIGHYETLNADAQFVLEKLGVASRVQFPSGDRDNKHNYNSTVRLAKMYADIPEADVNKLKTEVYAKDFAIFGYN